MDSTSRLLSVARGDTPADLVLTGGQIINVFSGEIESAEVAIADGRIAGVGTGYIGREMIDLHGAFVSPGFIDAHVHIESSLCTPPQFAAAVLPRGVTTVIADPHEIANVAGVAGVRFMHDASRNLPLDVILMASSCVPATNMSSTGGRLDSGAIAELINSGVAHGLAEVMNFPGVIHGDAELLAKIAAARGRPIDGHAPAVSGKALNAYAASGIGSDHECVIADEAREKLRRGLYLLIREATNARNLDALLPAITPSNSRRVCFCTDDRTPVHLLENGSVDEMVRRAIAAGIDPIEAIRMVTLNTSEMYGLREIGAIAPGRVANLVAFDDLHRPEVKLVLSRGKRTAENGRLIGPESFAVRDRSSAPLGACAVDWEKIRFEVPAKGKLLRVIGARPDQLVTDHRVLAAKIADGCAVAEVSRDILKMLVIERHHRTGSFGAGFIQGMGLKNGAIAGTVAHDHHNLVTIGADDTSMQTAARAAVASCGGLAVAVGDRVLEHLPLPVGGLMSDRPIAEVAADYAKLVAAAKELGSPLADPFMAMSFMALEVIPSLKLTDKGLVDVERFEIIDLFAG